MLLDQISLLIRRIWNSFFITLICYIPLWIYLLFRLILNPDGFWQNFFLVGMGVYFLGSLQAVLFLLWLYLMLLIWLKG